MNSPLSKEAMTIALAAALLLAGCCKGQPGPDRVDRQISANQRCRNALMEPRWVHDFGTEPGGEIRCYPKGSP